MIATPAAAAADSKKEEPTLPDADPEGAQYLKNVGPLQAMELLIKPLQSNPSAESAFLEFELAIRRSEPVLPVRVTHVLTNHDVRAILASSPGVVDIIKSKTRPPKTSRADRLSSRLT
jgi:hypothetical protein